MSKNENKPKSKPRKKGVSPFRKRLLRIAAGLLAVVVVYTAYVYFFVRADEGLAALFERLEEQGFTPNEGLFPLFEPGTVLQLMEDDGAGGSRRLKSPLRLVRATECFPDREPEPRAFPLPSATGSSKASLSLLARLLSTLKLDSSAVARYRLDPGETQILSFTKTDLSRHFSSLCVEALEHAQEDGDRLEWYGIVLEAVVADGLRLEMEWNRDVAAETRVSLQEDAKRTLPGGQVDVGVATGEESRTVIAAQGRVVLGYRVRPLDRKEDVADSEEPFGPRLASFPSPQQGSGEGQAESRQEPSSEALLRDAFLDDGKESDKIVGRLGLLLVEGSGTRQVGLDHAFRSGDRFRFEVTSGVRGWLYVLHRSPGREAQVLWPREGATSLVEAKAASVIPPHPQGFELDEEVGEERFYVAIRSAPDPGSALQPGAEGNARKEVQYVVRALDPPGRRGVFFDPGPQDDDLYVYFAPAERDDGTVAVAEFQLRHE